VNTDEFVNHLKARGLKLHKSGAGWSSCCSAHEDKTPSLDIATGNDGRVLLHCHAGCSPESVVSALGLAMADLFPSRASGDGTGRRIAATYDYADEAGTLLFQCVRFDPKNFRQRRPDSTALDGWAWNLKGVRRVIYRLPEVLAAVKGGRTVFVVEGEKDADVLVKAGFAATTCPMGAGKWQPEFSETLRGAVRVVVVADKDKPGREHAAQVAASVRGVAAKVILLELPDRDGKTVKDCADWLGAGGTAAELRALVNAAPEFAVQVQVVSCDTGDAPALAGPAWPAPLDPAAFYGLAGDLVRTIDPHTEADPAAVLVMFLAAFGSMAGAGAHFMAESRKHPARVWPVLVGETAKGRKGSAWSSLRYVLEKVDEVWLRERTGSGLSSGEGLIWAVHDPVATKKKNAQGVVVDTTVDDGVADKRLLAIEEEFSAVLKVASREGNTISDLLRRAWDSGDLRTMTRNSPLRATGAHVTVVGHITRADLSRQLAEVDALNGFGNRFLWVAVRRSKLLPEGGALHTADLAPLVLRLHRAVDYARVERLVNRSADAAVLWGQVYPELTSERPGLIGAITSRAEAQVMRVALVYALLDCSDVITPAHLRAALAVWNYCEQSARWIFGESLGDRVSDRVLDELRCAGADGLTRSALRDVFAKNITTAKLDAALALLHRFKFAFWRTESRQGVGRPSTVWRAVKDTSQPITQPDPVANVVTAAAPQAHTQGERGEPQPTPEPEPEPEPVAVGDDREEL
jgi:5S rRNA maturation endonuclease (ribonuclease M5)